MAFSFSFKRYEYKYLLDESQYQSLMSEILSYISPDKYGKSEILNIYFDTPDYRLIRTSIEKPFYKEKLRVRSYGIPSSSNPSFLELKKKYDSVVYKRRVVFSYKDALDFVDSPFSGSQIQNEIKYFLEFYKSINPMFVICYRREAFYATDSSDIRLTFDRDITYRTTDLNLESGYYGEQILPKGKVLMEIKVGGAMPLWLAHALSKHKIYKSSYSKYGEAYKHFQKVSKGVLTNV